MQKKICYVLLGYILILIIASGWFTFQRLDEQVAVIDEKLIEEILKEEISNEEISNEENSSGTGNEATYKEDLNLNLAEKRDEIASSNKDFWNKYYNSEEDNTNNSGKIDTAQVTAKLKNAEISTADKLKALYLIKKNLSKEDISYIVSLTKDGITSQEKSEIKSLLSEKLSKEDYEQLKNMLFKYL